METLMKIIQYQFEGFDAIHEAEEWCFESSVAETRSSLGIPIWIDYKQISDAQSKPHPAALAAISAVRNTIKPAVVHKPARKTGAKQKTPDVSPMLVSLDSTNPVNMVQEVLRDRIGGSAPTLPPGMD